MAPARAVCARCLVLDECRTWALEQPDNPAGVWGGLSSQERAKMRRAAEPAGRPLPLAPLEAASRLSRPALAKRLGVATSTLQIASTLGITEAQAQWWTTELGLRPERIWPGWAEVLAG